MANTVLYAQPGGTNGGGVGVSDGDKGDITVASSGTAWTVDNDAVTYAKLQNVSATSRVLGRKTSGAGDAEEMTLSEVLDFVGSAANGDILMRSGGSWVRLGAGTNGQVLTLASGVPSWATPSGGSGSTVTNRLNYIASSDLANGASLTEDAWYDLCSNQSFTVGASSSEILIYIGGKCVCGGAAAAHYGTRAYIDSGGSPQAFWLGGAYATLSTEYPNVLAGCGAIRITGLSAGTHTVKVQIQPDVSGCSAYCRASGSVNQGESLRIVVMEHTT